MSKYHLYNSFCKKSHRLNLSFLPKWIKSMRNCLAKESISIANRTAFTSNTNRHAMCSVNTDNFSTTGAMVRDLGGRVVVPWQHVRISSHLSTVDTSLQHNNTSCTVHQQIPDCFMSSTLSKEQKEMAHACSHAHNHTCTGLKPGFHYPS